MTRFGKLGRPSTILALTLAVLIAGSFLEHEFSEWNSRDGDFRVYYSTAQRINDNPRADLYRGALDGNPLAHFEVFLYLYPPLLADLLTPIARLPFALAGNVWRLVNTGLIFLSLLALARVVRISALSAEFGIFTVAAFSFFPIYEALSLGQVALLLLALWTVAIVAYSEGRIALSACALAFATGLKVTPVLLVPLFLLWKEKKWLAWYAGMLAALVLSMGAFNGVATLQGSAKVLANLSQGVSVMHNKCISSLVAWIFYGNFEFMQPGVDSPGPPHTLAMIQKVASLGFYVVCLLLVWRQRNKQDRMSRTITLAVFVLVTATTSPVSWRHAYAVALVPLALLWGQEVRSHVATARTWLLALATLAMGSLIFDLVAAQSHVPRVLQILSAGMLTLSTATLCIVTLMRSGAAQTAPDAPAT